MHDFQTNPNIAAAVLTDADKTIAAAMMLENWMLAASSTNVTKNAVNLGLQDKKDVNSVTSQDVHRNMHEK